MKSSFLMCTRHEVAVILFALSPVRCIPVRRYESGRTGRRSLSTFSTQHTCKVQYTIILYVLVQQPLYASCLYMLVIYTQYGIYTSLYIYAQIRTHIYAVYRCIGSYTHAACITDNLPVYGAGTGQAQGDATIIGQGYHELSQQTAGQWRQASLLDVMRAGAFRLCRCLQYSWSGTWRRDAAPLADVTWGASRYSSAVYKEKSRLGLGLLQVSLQLQFYGLLADRTCGTLQQAGPVMPRLL